jgi:methyl-accepting chemotaxis protein
MAASAAEQSTGIEQVNTAMTQMDQVTQSNSAQTEELSATAEALSEQASHLMELVNTFTLSQGGRNQRGRQGYQAHEAIPAHLVGESLVHSARPNLQQANSAPQSNQPAQRAAKASRGSASPKSNSRSRAAKGQSGQLPVLTAAAVPSGSTGNDASFEEF